MRVVAPTILKSILIIEAAPTLRWAGRSSPEHPQRQVLYVPHGVKLATRAAFGESHSSFHRLSPFRSGQWKRFARKKPLTIPGEAPTLRVVCEAPCYPIS